MGTPLHPSNEKGLTKEREGVEISPELSAGTLEGPEGVKPGRLP